MSVCLFRISGGCLRNGCGWSRRTWQTRRRFSPLSWYNKHLERSPVLTKSITSGVLFGMGDVIAQLIAREKGERIDLARVRSAVIFGAVILGPLAHLHFNFLEYLAVKRLALKGAKMVLLKVFVEQFTYWSPGINAVYLLSIPLLDGKGMEKAKENLCARYLATMKANYVLWPAAQMCNFFLVPVAHQLNFVLIVSLGWAAYLSWAGGKTAKKKAAA